MPTIRKEDSFSLEWDMDLWGVEFIDGLEMVSEEVWGGVVGRGLAEESEGEDGLDGVGEFLNYH